MSAHKTQPKSKDYSADILKFIAEDVDVDCHKVEKVVGLLTTENTVPFIARYRRHETGNLEAQDIRKIQESLGRVK
jgi:uncharacterized protein